MIRSAQNKVVRNGNTNCISCFSRGLRMKNESPGSILRFIFPMGFVIVGVIGYIISIPLTTGFTQMIFQWICIIAVITGFILLILDNWDELWGS